MLSGTCCNLAGEEEAKRRIAGLVVPLIAERVEVSVEIRLFVVDLERCQHATKIGAVAAIVEQRNVPVRAQRLQELQQRAGASGNSKLNSRSRSGFDGRPPTM